MYQIVTKTCELATKFLVLSRQKRLDFIFNFEPLALWKVACDLLAFVFDETLERAAPACRGCFTPKSHHQTSHNGAFPTW